MLSVEWKLFKGNMIDFNKTISSFDPVVESKFFLQDHDRRTRGKNRKIKKPFNLNLRNTSSVTEQLIFFGMALLRM